MPAQMNRIGKHYGLGRKGERVVVVVGKLEV